MVPVSISVVQPGSGSVRDIVLCWHGNFAPLAAVLPTSTAVVSQQLGSMGAYAEDSQVASVEEMQAAVGQDFTVGRLWLVGFSAGCQGVRTQLYRGVKPDVVLAADGIHLPKTPNPEKERPWLELYRRARSGGCRFSVSVSQVEAYEFLSTRASAAKLFGVSSSPPAGPPDAPVVLREGGFAFYAATGSGGEDHMAQLREVLPVMGRDATSGVGLVSSRQMFLYATAAALGWMAYELLG